MGSMKGKRTKVDAALGRLADMINDGNLLASADPVGFLDTIASELKDLRVENAKIRGLMSIEADKHNERQIMLQDTMEQLEELKARLIEAEKALIEIRESFQAAVCDSKRMEYKYSPASVTEVWAKNVGNAMAIASRWHENHEARSIEGTNPNTH